MELELADKVVLITGASGGLGRELALAYGRNRRASPCITGATPKPPRWWRNPSKPSAAKR